MLKEIVIAIQSYLKAHQFIKEHLLWKWIIVPGLIYAILFVTGTYFFAKSATGVISYFTHVSGLNDWVQKFQNSWLGFLFTLAGLTLWIILMFFYFSLFKYLWLILGSPVFGYLSEKTGAIIEGREYSAENNQVIKSIKRGVGLAFRNMFWQSVYTLSILLLSFVPIVGWATPILALFVECYYFGFSMMDYSCSRKELTPSQSILFISGHKGLAIGNGLVFYAMHFLLVVGWVVAPAYAVVAATISFYGQKEPALKT